MPATVNNTVRIHEDDGKKPAAKKSAAKESAAKKPTTKKRWHHKSRQQAFWNQSKVVITIVLGCAIPGFSLALSHVAGTLAHYPEFMWLACAAALCGVSVLAVSLSHLMHAIEQLTGAEWWQALALAVTIDAGLCVAELTQVFAHSVGLHYWTTGLIAAVAALSAILNTFAFLHPPERKAAAEDS